MPSWHLTLINLRKRTYKLLFGRLYYTKREKKIQNLIKSISIYSFKRFVKKINEQMSKLNILQCFTIFNAILNAALFPRCVQLMSVTTVDFIIAQKWNKFPSCISSSNRLMPVLPVVQTFVRPVCICGFSQL